MSANNLVSGAVKLQQAALTIAHAASIEGRAAGGLSDEAAAKVVKQLSFGARQVERLGNPFFERVAANLRLQAESVKHGAAQPLKVIAAAHEGAGYLLSRSMYVA